MPTQKHYDGLGYSPPISIELQLHGESFNVASVGPDGAILRNARIRKPGVGVVRMDVDGSVTLYEVDVFNGIDPQVQLQPFVIIGVTCEDPK